MTHFRSPFRRSRVDASAAHRVAIAFDQFLDARVTGMSTPDPDASQQPSFSPTDRAQFDALTATVQHVVRLDDEERATAAPKRTEATIWEDIMSATASPAPTPLIKKPVRKRISKPNQRDAWTTTGSATDSSRWWTRFSPVLNVAMVAILLIVLGLSAFAVTGGIDRWRSGSDGGQGNPKELASLAAQDPGTPGTIDHQGVVTYFDKDSASDEHVPGEVLYEQIPPVGGPHADTWQDCGFYDGYVKNTNAVHSMENGAVWITYDPNLPSDQLDVLKDKAKQTYVLVSPYPELPSPIVVSAWGTQLLISDVKDPQLDQFIEKYRENRDTTPASGALCTLSVGDTTPNRPQTSPYVRAKGSNSIGGIALSTAQADLPTAAECMVAPLTIDEVMDRITTSPSVLPGAKALSSPEMNVSPSQETIDQIAIVHREFMACLIKGDPFKVWAFISPSSNYWQNFLIRYPPFVDEDTVRSDLQRYENGEYVDEFSYPVVAIDPNQRIPLVSANPLDSLELSSFETSQGRWQEVQVGMTYYSVDDPSRSPTNAPWNTSNQTREFPVWTYVWDPAKRTWMLGYSTTPAG